MLVKFRNNEAFFASEYFERNKMFDTVHIFLLNQTGEKMAMITFYGLEVEFFNQDAFNYNDNEAFCTEVGFKFKKVTHSNNTNKIEKDPQ